MNSKNEYKDIENAHKEIIRLNAFLSKQIDDAYKATMKRLWDTNSYLRSLRSKQNDTIDVLAICSDAILKALDVMAKDTQTQIAIAGIRGELHGKLSHIADRGLCL